MSDLCQTRIGTAGATATRRQQQKVHSADRYNKVTLLNPQNKLAAGWLAGGSRSRTTGDEPNSGVLWCFASGMPDACSLLVGEIILVTNCSTEYVNASIMQQSMHNSTNFADRLLGYTWAVWASCDVLRLRNVI